MLDDIQTILSHPRYREFAAAVTECGRQVVPDAYPWKHMGLSDDAFLALPLRFENGVLMNLSQKQAQLRVVRWAEENVRQWWRWWGGWEWLHRTREASIIPAPAAPEPGFLF